LKKGEDLKGPKKKKIQQLTNSEEKTKGKMTGNVKKKRKKRPSIVLQPKASLTEWACASDCQGVGANGTSRTHEKGEKIRKGNMDTSF